MTSGFPKEVLSWSHGRPAWAVVLVSISTSLWGLGRPGPTLSISLCLSTCFRTRMTEHSSAFLEMGREAAIPPPLCEYVARNGAGGREGLQPGLPCVKVQTQLPPSAWAF